LYIPIVLLKKILILSRLNLIKNQIAQNYLRVLVPKELPKFTIRNHLKIQCFRKV
jgi:hypothetical protein